MNLIWNFTKIFILFILYFNVVYCKPKLILKKGIVEGQILKSRDGRSYYSYTGLPYAKPPIGNLRFKAPEPVDPWNGTLDATKEANECLQPGKGQEDCLYLNVYSPQTNKTFLPVIFFIHGGGFTSGSSRSGNYGPDYFMDKDVVLVTTNYRLGILGFLSTEDDVIPGNYGMKDQVEALRWVQENIGKFNGNPNRVTMMGTSTGSACVGFHMLSPLSKGLFHKAILQSGSPVNKWAIYPPGLVRQRTMSAAYISGCYFNTSVDILNCFRQLPAKYMIELHNKLFSWLKYPLILFTPVVERCTSNQKSFLCHHPSNDFKQESFVPVIIGSNSAEGGFHTAALYNSTALVQTELRSNFNHFFPILSSFTYYTKPQYIDDIGEKVLNKYFPSGRIDDDSHKNAVKMFTESFFAVHILDMAYQLSSPVYSYYYDYQNEFSFNKGYGKCEKSLGVTHGDELNSLFKISNLNTKDLNKNDLEVSKLMVNIWYKFINSDNPTIDGLDNGLPWPKFTRSNQTMLYLNSIRPTFIQNPLKSSHDFWSKLPINFVLNY